MIVILTIGQHYLFSKNIQLEIILYLATVLGCRRIWNIDIKMLSYNFNNDHFAICEIVTHIVHFIIFVVQRNTSNTNMLLCPFTVKNVTYFITLMDDRINSGLFRLASLTISLISDIIEVRL